MQIDVSQVHRLASDLAAAPARVEREVGEVLADGADDLAARARALVPVATGATRASIQASGSGLEQVVSAGGAAIFLEYGTSRMAPRSFLRPAAEVVEPQLAQGVERAASRVLDG